MNLLTKLLLAIAAMGVLGSGQAAPAGRVSHPATHAPADSSPPFESVASDTYSFADIVNLPAGAEHRLLADESFNRLHVGAWADSSNPADSTLTRPAGAKRAGSLMALVSIMSGAIDDLSGLVVAEEFSAFRARTADWRGGAQFLFSATEIPEPAGWMTLLCGLVVAAFIARRRSAQFAD